MPLTIIKLKGEIAERLDRLCQIRGQTRQEAVEAAISQYCVACGLGKLTMAEPKEVRERPLSDFSRKRREWKKTGGDLRAPQ